jgi:hypothetical protein
MAGKRKNFLNAKIAEIAKMLARVFVFGWGALSLTRRGGLGIVRPTMFCFWRFFLDSEIDFVGVELGLAVVDD